MKRLSVLLALLPAACAPMGPDYRRPEVETPAQYRESAEWKFARPSDHLPRGAWWTVFGDSTLNRLENDAAADSPALRAALLRVEQARVTARGAAAARQPSAGFDPSAERRGDSGNLQRSKIDYGYEGTTWNAFRLPFSASYEVDFWGRVRRTVEAAEADAAAAEALGETARLALQADLAWNYFTLRSVEAERRILEDSVTLRQQALKLITDRFEGGAISELDVARTESELATAQSDLLGLEKRRGELINAIAVLAGHPASSFQLRAAPLTGSPPAIPAGIPAALLERRPDIAEAERKMAAASARTGAAKAAFYPSLRLNGRLALESSDAAALFSPDSRSWALGPAVNFPVFDQAVHRTQFEKRRLEFEETAATYRQTVLLAFQEVENSLAGLRLLASQDAAQKRAVSAAEKAAALSRDRYASGAVSFLEVLDAERTRLQSLRESQQIAGQRFLTAVQLIKALGGGW